MVFRSIAELPPELTVSINHIASVSAPFISPLTLLLLYLPALFISLFLWKIALFCFSAAHPPACLWCARVCGLVVGPSTCVALNFWPQILRRLTTAKQREREWGSTGEEKPKIFSPTSLSLSAWIKFSQLPPMAFMDTICLLRDHSTHTCDGLWMKHIFTNNHLISL